MSDDRPSASAFLDAPDERPSASAFLDSGTQPNAAPLWERDNGVSQAFPPMDALAQKDRPDTTTPEDSWLDSAKKVGLNAITGLKAAAGYLISTAAETPAPLGAGLLDKALPTGAPTYAASQDQAAKWGHDLYTGAETAIKANQPNISPDSAKAAAAAIGDTVANLIPIVAISSVSPEAGLAYMGVTSGAQHFQSGVDQGKSPGKAGAEAIGMSSLETLTAMVPLRVITSGTGSLVEHVVNSAAAFGAQSGVVTAIEQAYNAHELADKQGIPFTDAWNQLGGWDEVKRQTAIGAAAGGITGAGHRAMAGDSLSQIAKEHMATDFDPNGARQAAVNLLSPDGGYVPQPPPADVASPGAPSQRIVDKGPIKPGDTQSPIPTDLLQEGNKIVQDAAPAHPDDILARNGLPPMGSRVNLDMGDGNQQGGVLADAFTQANQELGLSGDGVRIHMDNGTVFEDYIQAMKEAGAMLSPQDSGAPEEIPGLFSGNKIETAAVAGTAAAQEPGPPLASDSSPQPGAETVDSSPAVGLGGRIQSLGDAGTRENPIEVTTPEHLDQARAQIATPSDGQKDGGNYAKGHITWNGLDIALETGKGMERSGTSPTGEPWSVTMPSDYGYVKRTTGADGDHVDIYMGPNPESTKVFVVDQYDTETHAYDEHKSMLGFNDQASAEKAYDAAFSDNKGPARRVDVTPMSVDEFKAWLDRGDTTKPAADQELPKPSADEALKGIGTKKIDLGGADEAVKAGQDDAKQLATDIKDRYIARGFREDVAEKNTTQKGAVLRALNKGEKPKEKPPAEGGDRPGAVEAAPLGGERVGVAAKADNQKIPGESKSETPDAKVIKARAKRTAEPEGGADALTFLASRGGLRDNEGHDLKGTLALDKFIPGHGPLLRKNGMSVSAAGEMLWDHGYFGPVGTQDGVSEGVPHPTEGETIRFLEKAAATKTYLPDLQAGIEAERKAGIEAQENKTRRNDVAKEEENLGIAFKEGEVQAITDLMQEHGIDAETAVEWYLEHEEVEAAHDIEKDTGAPFEIPYEGGQAEAGGPVGEAGARSEGQSADEGQGSPRGPPRSQGTTESVNTVDGKREQGVIPGTEQSAKQAAQARGPKIKPKAGQQEPGGMFEEKPPEEPGLFGKQSPRGWQPGDDIFSAETGSRVRFGDAEATRIRDSLTKLLKQYNISDKVALRLMEKIQGPRSEADGKYLNRLIEISLNSQRGAERTLNHEVIHALRDLGLFRPSEWAALSAAARADKALMARVRDLYKGNTEDKIVEEAVALMHERYGSGKFVPKGLVKSGLDRIAWFFKSLKASFNDAGFKTPKDIFEAIHRGEIGKRTETAQNGDGGFALRRDDKDILYSALTRAIENHKQPKAPADQWKGIIDKLPGIKKDEVEWSGVKEWLDEQKGTVTREALLEYLKANEVELHEKTLGKTIDPALQARHIAMFDKVADELVNKHRWNRDDAMEFAGKVAENDLTTDEIKFIGGDKELYAHATNLLDSGRMMDRSQADTSKFGTHVLPGGENYREKLLTLPGERDAMSAYDKRLAEVAAAHGRSENPSGFANYATAAESRELTTLAEKSLNAKDFTAGYFNEPNVLAHVRMNDRTGPNGEKILHLEELQSDWHQKGRRQGYTPRDADQLQARRREIEALGRDATPEQKQEWANIMNRLRPDNRDVEGSTGYRGVPDAPFKSTWHELAFKAALRHAVENGYDKMTWTTGEQQAARYDLSKHVSSVIDDNGILIARDKGGAAVFSEDVPKEKWPDYIGKDAAEKLASKTPDKDGLRRIDGLELKVGGEGMKGFYDKIVPDYARKLGKKWGAEVGKADIGRGPEDQHSVEYISNSDNPYEDRSPWVVRDESRGGAVIERHPTEEAARLSANQMNNDARGGPLSVHSIDITPQMRESVMAGQPMFAVGEPIAFDNPETEKRWQQARKGIASAQSWRDRISDGLDAFKAAATRHYLHLPNETRFADVREQLRKLEAAPTAAKEQIVRILKDLTGKMSASDLDLFTRKVVLDDLMWEAQQDHDLPFGMSPEDVRRELSKVDLALSANPDLSAKVRERKLIVRSIAQQLVDAGVLNKEQIKNPAYYRHQVIDYAKAQMEMAASGTAASLRSPKWAKRMGSKLDINANLLEAEFDWLHKALTDVATAKTIQGIKDSEHNIRDTIVSQAKEHNKTALAERIAETPELGAQQAEFSKRIAMGIAKVKQAIKDGLSLPKEFKATSDAILNDTHDPNVFRLLSYMLDNNTEGSLGAAQAFKAIANRNAWTKKILGENYANVSDIPGLVKRFGPEGYSAWQPDEGKLMYTAKTLPEHVIDRMLDKLADEGTASIPKEDVRAAMDAVRPLMAIGGDKYHMVLPDEIANTLKNLRPPASDALVNFMIEKPMRAWKVWTLISPRRVLKYNINNMSGDLDAVIAGNPSALKRFPQAFKEIKAVMYGGADPTPQYREAVERGVFDSGLTIQEVPDINDLSEFSHLLEKNQSAIEKGLGIPMRVWGQMKKATQFRENWLRYAAYIDYKNRLDAGESMKTIGYGASPKQMVDGLKTNSDKAALLARELIGDYGAVSHLGGLLRKRLLPFWSWNEVNTRRYWRLGINAWDQGIGSGLRTSGIIGASLGIKTTAYLALRAMVIYGAVATWNNLVFGDEEKELSDVDRNRLHINLGHDSAGAVRLLRFQGALSDFLGWVGFQDAVDVMGDIDKGRATYGDLMATIAKAPVNKIVGNLTPLLTAPFETLAGVKIWPDIFNPTAIHDKWRNLAQTFSLENEYDAVTGKPSRGYAQSLEGSVTYKRDVGEESYNNIRNLAYDWLNRTKGEEGISSVSTPRSEALYNWRLALRYGDTEAAAKYMAQMKQLGMKRSDLEASLKRANPLGPIPLKDRSQFLATLTPKERAQIHDAAVWYRSTFLEGVRSSE